MSTFHLLRRACHACGLVVLAGVAMAPALFAGPLTRSERIASLERAVADPGFTSWQREYYARRLELVRAGAVESTRGEPSASASSLPTPVWEPVAETPRRMGHTLVVDTLTDRAIAFGGENAAVMSNDVFTVALSGPLAWRKLAVAGPAPAPR
jgi:hypothetical protein